jgi:hypothetical protein
VKELGSRQVSKKRTDRLMSIPEKLEHELKAVIRYDVVGKNLRVAS